MLFLPPTSGQNQASTIWKAAFDYLMPQRFLFQFYKSILAIIKRIWESERPLCSAASRKNFVNEENLLEKLCGTRNSESLSNSVDQLGEI